MVDAISSQRLTDRQTAIKVGTSTNPVSQPALLHCVVAFWQSKHGRAFIAESHAKWSLFGHVRTVALSDHGKRSGDAQHFEKSGSAYRHYHATLLFTCSIPLLSSSAPSSRRARVLCHFAESCDKQSMATVITCASLYAIKAKQHCTIPLKTRIQPVFTTACAPVC